jgi:ribosomal protein L37AE/L43A
MNDEFRLRKVCPACESLNIGKNQKHGTYHCKACGAAFQIPKLKEMRTNKNTIPEQLKLILEKKQKEALACDKP